MNMNKALNTSVADIRSKVDTYGFGSLTDLELLQVFFGKKAVTLATLSAPAATGLADRKSSFEPFTLVNLLENDPEFYTYIGVSKAVAFKLRSIVEISKRLWKETKAKGKILSNPETVADYYMQDLRCADQEYAYALLLDTHNRLIKSEFVGKGTIDSCSLSPRDIIKSALLNQAASFILVHNHPSGVCDPSSEDIHFSRTLRDAGKLMNIRMNDSIIIGDNCYVSLKQDGLI